VTSPARGCGVGAYSRHQSRAAPGGAVGGRRSFRASRAKEATTFTNGLHVAGQKVGPKSPKLTPCSSSHSSPAQSSGSWTLGNRTRQIRRPSRCAARYSSMTAGEAAPCALQSITTPSEAASHLSSLAWSAHPGWGSSTARYAKTRRAARSSRSFRATPPALRLCLNPRNTTGRSSEGASKFRLHRATDIWSSRLGSPSPAPPPRAQHLVEGVCAVRSGGTMGRSETVASVRGDSDDSQVSLT
jgi:hypothetical protein